MLGGACIREHATFQGVRAYVVAFLALVIACSSATRTEPPAEGPPPAPPPTYHVCMKLAAGAPVPEIMAGVSGWAYSTRGWRRWAYGAPCELVFLEVDELEVCDVVASACTRVGTLIRGAAPAYVYLVRGKYEHGARYVVMHEIGHSLGLDHSDGCIRSATAGPLTFSAEWQCPDSATITRLEWEHGVRLRSCVQPIPGLLGPVRAGVSL